jgi:predicted ATPase
MLFLVTRSPRKLDEYPFVILRPDTWNDYGYVATFSAELHLSRKSNLELENVKIVVKDQENGQTPMPEGVFTKLDADYCSLGQSISYYEMLYQAGKDVYAPYLVALRDMVFLPNVRKKFEDENGVRNALLRFSSATAALDEAPQLFRSGRGKIMRSPIEFTYELPSSDIRTDFVLGDIPELPSRTAAIIGYNGAGKTRLLSHLAMLAYENQAAAVSPEFAQRYGRYVGDVPSFGAIVAVSYSAFDDFKLPGSSTEGNADLERKRQSEGRASAGNYTYLGLRQVDTDGNVSNMLKGPEQLTKEFHAAHRRARKDERLETLRLAFAPVQDEPSINMIADLPAIDAGFDQWGAAFAQLSTGHKIVLNIVIQLCANLERRSLLLFDEPELHLHPPLLAALLKAVSVALDRYDSFAIVATHSPVVLQEIPARYVKVLRRYPSGVAVEPPEVETFGENVGLLTKQVFSLDSSATDYQGVLLSLARRYSVVEIEEFFEGALSSQARSLVMSVQRAQGSGDAKS